jgi:eukaryotic-like serine/threonine-protein kinase
VTTITSALEPVVSGPSGPAPERPAGLVSWYTEGFSDRFGDRLLLFDNQGPGLELLRFHRELGALPEFEAALRARVEALAPFLHPGFARVRSLTRLDDPDPRLALVSELAEGERLSTVLAAARRAGKRLEPGSAVWLLRHLLTALADLHDAGPNVHHGILTPDRVMITPGGVAITEYVLGEALATLERTSSDGMLRRSASAAGQSGAARDVEQAARLALGVLLGRPVRDESADTIVQALDGASDGAGPASLLRPWLLRALAIDGAGFSSARSAQAELDELVPRVGAFWSPPALESAPATPSVAPVPLERKRANPERSNLTQTFAPVVSPVVEADHARSRTVRRLQMACAALALVALVEALTLAVLVPRQPGPAAERVAAAPVPSAARTEALASVSEVVPPTLQPGPAAEAPHSPLSSASGLAPAIPAPARVPTPATAPVASGHDGAPPMPAAAPAASPVAAAGEGSDSVIGWVSVDAPFEVRVYANGRLLGSGVRPRYRLPEGRHMITVASDEHGIRSTQAVDVVPGQTALIALDSPSQ